VDQHKPSEAEPLYRDALSMQTQLEIYRNPKSIAALAKDFRGKFEEVPGAGGEVELPPVAGGRAHPMLWAAFTISGLGR
jgi:hypothetical protein